jgi:hypothetical protein
VQRTVDISRDLTLKWAEAAGTLSGAVREQAESVGSLVREQAGSAREFVHEQAGQAEQAEKELAREAVGGGSADGPLLAAVVTFAFLGPGGSREVSVGALERVRDLLQQGGLVGLDQEGDRLRRFRAVLPCEVVVTAVTHPLYGCRLRAYAVRHVDGVPHLKVELPDGMPGLVAVEATDAFGAEAAGAGGGLVLDGDGLRRLRAVVTRLRDGDASGPRR